ncbi:efflux RND transporter permease subunit [Ottowia sp.]|uniref:efflux RND transporter permease subunit n=3 Tax=Ottowia sp. TaxID=1898956 RepID=UPI002CDBD222|nr:efflux RND transporter permease subunit [Ottowia sp.]HOB66096.1 efflux RND transporter permease subunit [Ottowia sp.]HQD48039.1 efflux RND transporter permease subunit [Ottowia sp.]
MAKFFIDRPIFAWVIALFLMVLGAISITQLPVAQYPSVAPPTIVLSATYPGASAQTLEDAVLSVIEREMNGSPGLAYMESVAQANGTGQITLSFEPGTNADLAQVDVQNRLSRASPRLPTTVVQQGVRVDKSRSNFLLFTVLSSSDPNFDITALSDYASRNVVPELQRLPGIGQVQLFGAERAMRVWIEPAKLQSYNLSPADVANAIAQQNAQVSAGSLGDLPLAAGQTMSATVVVPGQISTAEQFGNITLRANADGSTVRLKDVARIELGAQSYATAARLNGQPAAGMGVQLSTSGNALAAAKAVRTRMAELERYFPPGVTWKIPYDSSDFVRISITEVVKTLFEAVALVFLVMFLFLQNWRYTVIPTIVVPVALLATFGALLAFGMSINVLTMFGMVLVIGIVVDDAIVVVENVERIMSEEGLPPLAATRKAMSQISGAIIGVTVVLISVFVPLAFFAGSVGNIYRQFSAVMAVSIFFSAFLALSLTPALCATLLKPVDKGHHVEKRGFFGWFNRRFARTAKGYEGIVARLVRRAGRLMVIYLALAVVVGWLYVRLPTSFLPQEDQGNILVNMQLPPGATLERTQKVVEQVEGYLLKQPEVANMVAVMGFSFSGQGQNAALSFVSLKPWDERKGAEHSAGAIAGRAMGALSGIKDAFIFPLSPPPIPELGVSSGFTFRLQDRAGKGHEALIAARNQMLGMAMQSKVLAGVRPDGLEDAPQLQVDIDRDKAAAQGVTFAAINSAISASLGSAYVNDFPNQGRLQRVIIQADAPARMQPEDILQLTALNSKGQAVPLSAFASTRWITGAMQTVRYNGYPAVRIAGGAAPGFSTGEAMREMEQLAAKLPEGFGYEWTGQSREEKLAGNQALILYGFAILAVFLALAALYESWSIPFAVILVVPLGVLGVLLAVTGRGMLNDVYFQVGLITIIGLSAKNAILIIEFAKDLQAQGMSVLASALAAAHLRFRPIVMTSMAFILGVLPLAMASGAGSAAQRAIGTGVIGGMIVGTFLAVFFVPLFFVVVRSLFKGSAHERERAAEHATEAGITADAAQHYVDDAETGLSDAERRALNQGDAPSNPKDHP